MQRAVAFSLAILAVTSATAVTWVATVDIHLPEPTGVHAVGRQAGSFGVDRRVAYDLYHPAVAGTGHAGPYMPPAIADAVAARDLGAFAHVPDPWSRIEHPLRDGAEWAPGRFPLLVFSPGGDVQPQYYSSLLAELASHGYVVAALSHPDLTPFIAYPDGTTATSVEPPRPAGLDALVLQHEARIEAVAADIQAAAGHLLAEFAAHLDGRLAAFGHSLGGAGAATAAAREPAIAAVGDLDGSLGAGARHVALGRPVLFMTDGGPAAPADQEARAAFVRGGSPGLKVTLHGAGHMTFATDVNFLEEAVPFQDGDSLGALEAHRDVARPLLQFFAQAFAVP